MLTDRVQAARAPELDVLDARFIAATVQDSDGALGRFFMVDNRSGWWWRRLPLLRLGQFARDIDDL